MNSLRHKITLIGASTGGPGLIEKIITQLPSSIESSIVIAQHMQKHFLSSFAKRLERISKLEVVLVEEKEALKRSKIYLLADSIQLKQTEDAIFLQKSHQESFYHPDIDMLFLSAAQLQDVAIKAYLLSGIGSDGAKGLLALKAQGAYTIAQDETSSIVYGMPKSACAIDAHCKVLSIDAIATEIKESL